MKTSIILIITTALLNISYATNPQNELITTKTRTMENSAHEQIKTLLFTYRDALNTSNVKKVLSLYTEDGVFMPSGAPTSIGTEQVKGAYEYVFSTIQLSIEFYIDEIEVIGDYAVARTTSKGSVLILANGETVPEENRELFVLKIVDGSWLIDRYMFNKMQ
jgi:uncharacterized protein (TIGR02246 family)